MDLEVVIKPAASAASRKTKCRGPRSREAPGRRLGNRTAAGRAASLDLGPLDLDFLEAAPAVDLITAFRSLAPVSTASGSAEYMEAHMAAHMDVLEAALAADLTWLPKMFSEPPFQSLSNPFLDTAVQKSALPRELQIAIPASLMQVDDDAFF